MNFLYLKRPSINSVNLFKVHNNLLLKMADHFAKFLQIRHKFWSGAETKVNHQRSSRDLKVQQFLPWVFIIKAQYRDIDSGTSMASFLRDISPQNVQKGFFHFRAEHGVPKIIWIHLNTLSISETTFASLLRKVE